MAKTWVEDKESVPPEQASIIETNIMLMDLSAGYCFDAGEEVEFYTEQLEKHKKLMADVNVFESFCRTKNYSRILKDIENWKTLFDPPHLLKIFSELTF